MIVPTYTEEQVTHEVETEMRDFLVPLSDKKQPKHCFGLSQIIFKTSSSSSISITFLLSINYTKYVI